jgi:hypothetical protein
MARAVDTAPQLASDLPVVVEDPMPKRIAAALIIVPMLLTACAHRTGEASLNERERASCERTIYRTADYDGSNGLRCAQLLGLWD